MKKRLFMIAGLSLLMIAAAYIVWDLFRPSKPASGNQISIDTSRNAPLLYRPLFSFVPGMERITGILSMNDDVIWVCGKDKLKAFDYRGKPLDSIAVYGTPGCIGKDQDENLIIAISENIVVMDKKGKILRKINKPDTLSVITSVAGTSEGIITADAGLKSVYVLDERGKKKRTIGQADPGKGIKSIIIPSPFFDICPAEGGLWVANTGRHLLEKFDNDGNLLTTWGYAAMTPDGFCGCCNPCNFTILSDGSFVTCEKGIPRVKVYDPKGNFLGMVAGPDQFEEGTAGLDVAVDSNDRIYVLDPVKNKITVYVRS